MATSKNLSRINTESISNTQWTQLKLQTFDTGQPLAIVSLCS